MTAATSAATTVRMAVGTAMSTTATMLEMDRAAETEKSVHQVPRIGREIRINVNLRIDWSAMVHVRTTLLSASVVVSLPLRRRGRTSTFARRLAASLSASPTVNAVKIFVVGALSTAIATDVMAMVAT